MDQFPDSAYYGISYFFMTMVVAGIAQGKGRSGFNWWLIALFISPPLALFLLLFFDNIHPKVETPNRPE